MKTNKILLVSLLKEVEDSDPGLEKVFADFAKELNRKIDTVVKDEEGNVSEETINEAGIVTALGLALSVPALMKILGYGLKLGNRAVAKLKGTEPDPKSLGDKIIHTADHIHHKFVAAVEFVLKPFIKDEKIREKAADYIFHAIILLLLVDAGVGIYKGIKAVGNIDLKTLSFLGSKAGIKAGELGARASESQLLGDLASGLIALFKGVD